MTERPTARGLRVFWVIRTFDLGGAERVLLEVLPSFREAGIGVEAFAVARQGGRLMPLLRAAGVPARVLGDGPADPRWVGRLRRLLRDRRPDVLHLSDPIAGAGGRLAAMGTGVPIVYTEHGRWEAHRLLSRWANALTYGMNDASVAVSDEVLASVARHPLGRRHARSMRTIANGLDLEQVRRDAEAAPGIEVPEGAFGTIAHLAPVKGPDVVIRAAAILQRSMPGRPCVLVGGGPMERELRGLAGELGVDVVFAGVRSDARAICARLEVVVQSSRSEGLPLAVLEAMALGRPIVAAAVGGIPQLLTDGVDALLVPPEDPEALADAIGRLLADPELASRLGDAARDAAQAHDAATAAGELAAVYRNVLAS